MKNLITVSVMPLITLSLMLLSMNVMAMPQKHKLPFAETIKVSKVQFKGSLLKNASLLFKELPVSDLAKEM